MTEPAAAGPPALSRAQLYAIVFIEGFCSLGAEVLALRQLVPREFWQSTRRVLTADGVLIANLILDGQLATPYARNLLATIESVYGRCAVEVLHRRQPLSNVVVVCHARSEVQPTGLYVDERNAADLDLARSR